MKKGRVKNKILAILGYPLAHSLSPFIQQAALNYRRFSWYYIPLEINPLHLSAAIRGLRSLENFAGANVTIPHKVAVIPFLDYLSAEVKATGAVNTIVVKAGKWKGYNTDIHGFLEPLRRRRFQLRGKQVVLLGSGGAARAVLYALGREKAKTVTVLCRHFSRARQMAAALEAYLPHTRLEIYSFNDPVVTKKLQEAELLVNATSLGMQGAVKPPIPPPGINSRLLVYDLIYNPPLTPLLKLAKKKGARIINGQDMLLAQGAAAFELWTRQPAPQRIMRQALHKALNVEDK